MKLFTTGFCHQNTGAYLKQMWGGRGTSVEIGWWWYCKQLGLDPFHSCYCHSCNNGIRVNDDIFRNKSFFLGGEFLYLNQKVQNYYIIMLSTLQSLYFRGDLNWKNPKNFIFCPKFSRPPPPPSKKGPTDENVGISYLIVILKFGFFETSVPSPPISPESRTSPIFTIEVAPKGF